MPYIVTLLCRHYAELMLAIQCIYNTSTSHAQLLQQLRSPHRRLPICIIMVYASDSVEYIRHQARAHAVCLHNAAFFFFLFTIPVIILLY